MYKQDVVDCCIPVNIVRLCAVPLNASLVFFRVHLKCRIFVPLCSFKIIAEDILKFEDLLVDILLHILSTTIVCEKVSI